MSVNAVSSEKNASLAMIPAAGQSSAWNGHEVAAIDQAYLSKQDVEAGGVGPGMFDGLGRGIITIACLFATVVATVAVAIATLAWQSAVITLIIGAIGTFAIDRIIYCIDPKC